jgi:hypothetical protein
MKDFSIVMGRDNIVMVLDMLKIAIYVEDDYGWMLFDYFGVISVAMNIPTNIGNIWSKWSTTR